MQRFSSLAPLAKLFLWLTVVSGLAGVMLLSATYLYLSPKLPSVEALREAKLQIPLRIYSQNGQLIGEFGEKRRSPLEFDQIPPQFIQAILAAEDDRFMQHRGIDIMGLVRAAGQLAVTGEIQSGGSTITMQVARNFFLSSEQTFLRKFNEILLALQIENELSKEEILALYVNKIYLGKKSYGIEAAAQVYYDKSVGELDLAQLAMIAGLPKAPSAFNPIANPERALLRRDWILGRMRKLNYITDEQLQSALAQPVTAANHGTKLDLDAAYVAEMARQFAVEQFGKAAYIDGYSVYTTIHSDKQAAANRAIRDGLIAYDQRHGYRGPELRLGETAIDNADKTLAQLRTVTTLLPGLVLTVDKDHLSVKLEGQEAITLELERQASNLRPFLTPNSRGPAPDDFTQVFAPGDVIRVQNTGDDNYVISQIPSASAALVSLNPTDGAIVALVGGLDFQRSKFNIAIQAKRQPGSNFKPFIYAAAFENGYTSAHVINDAPIVFDDELLESSWRPENAGGKFHGPTTLRRALYLSRNLVSIRLLRELGLGKAIRYLRPFELGDEPLPTDLSLALGSYAMTPLQTAKAYAVLANGGFKVEPYLITSIQDIEGSIVYRANPAIACRRCELEEQGIANTEARSLDALLNTQANANQSDTSTAEQEDTNENTEPEESLEPVLAPRIIEARTAYIIDNILQDVIRRGTGIKAKALQRNDIAGKTGTTNGPTDAWFSGYHPNLVATAWLGFDDNQTLGNREYGGSAALPIWIDYMRFALDGLPEARREQPEGITSVRINRLTGELATPSDTDVIFELFREELAPQAEELGDAQQPSHQDNGDNLFDEGLF